MKKALKAAAKVLMDIHDGQAFIDQQVVVPPKIRKRPRGLCHCQHCVFTRLEESRP